MPSNLSMRSAARRAGRRDAEPGGAGARGGGRTRHHVRDRQRHGQDRDHPGTLGVDHAPLRLQQGPRGRRHRDRLERPQRAGQPRHDAQRDPIDVGTPGDNNVHTTSGGRAAASPAGRSTAGYNTGSFGGISHTYTGAVPGDDLRAGLRRARQERHAQRRQGHDRRRQKPQQDNSAEKNGQTPAGNVCAAVKITPAAPRTAARRRRRRVAARPRSRSPRPGPASAAAGSDVAFTLTVTNPGAQPLTDVTIADPRCNATPPALQTNERRHLARLAGPGRQVDLHVQRPHGGHRHDAAQRLDGHRHPAVRAERHGHRGGRRAAARTGRRAVAARRRATARADGLRLAPARTS